MATSSQDQDHNDITFATVQSWRKETIFITKSVNAVEDKISSKDCVCVIGVPGAGKSTALHHAALSLENEGFIIYIISGPIEFFKYYDKSKKQVFLLDNALGIYSISQSEITSWQKQSERVRNVLGENTKLLVSIRTPIFTNETIREKDILFLNTSLTIEHVDFSTSDYRIGIDEMRGMLRHCLTTKEVDVDKIDKIVQWLWPLSEKDLTTEGRQCRDMSRYTTGLEFSECFPLLCKVFVDSDLAKENSKVFFNNPFKAMIKIFSNIKSENSHQYCALVLCAVFDGEFNEDLFSSFCELNKGLDEKALELRNTVMASCDLEGRGQLFKVKSALNSLTSTYVSQIEGIYKMSHVVFHDIVTYLYRDPLFVFTYGTSEFLRDRVRTSDSPLHDPYTIVYSDDKNIERLADRLIRDFKSNTRKGAEFIINNPNIDNDRLIAYLRSKCFDREPINRELINELFRQCMLTVYRKSNTYKHGDVTQYKLIESCVKSGVDCNMCIVLGICPLHISVGTGSLELTNLFLQNGADKRRVDFGDSVLHFICMHTKYNKLELIKLLTQQGDQSVIRLITNDKHKIEQELGRYSHNVILEEILSDHSTRVLPFDKHEISYYLEHHSGQLHLVECVHDNILTYIDPSGRNMLHYSVDDVKTTRYLLGLPLMQKLVNQCDMRGRPPYWYVDNDIHPYKYKIDVSDQDREAMKQLYKDNHAIM